MANLHIAWNASCPIADISMVLMAPMCFNAGVLAAKMENRESSFEIITPTPSLRWTFGVIVIMAGVLPNQQRQEEKGNT